MAHTEKAGQRCLRWPAFQMPYRGSFRLPDSAASSSIGFSAASWRDYTLTSLFLNTLSHRMQPDLRRPRIRLRIKPQGYLVLVYYTSLILNEISTAQLAVIFAVCPGRTDRRTALRRQKRY